MSMCASFASTPPHVSNDPPGVIDSISIDSVSYIMDYMRSDGTKIYSAEVEQLFADFKIIASSWWPIVTGE